MLEQYGNYELVRRLAMGGMAEIFLARQIGLEGFEKEICIKRILPHLASETGFVRMFLDEARIAARLNHPNIAQILNLGAQNGTYFIAMEYVDGRDVRGVWKLCDQRGEPMPAHLAVRVIAQSAAALQHAHKATNRAGKPLGIVHRDVSPQNILISTAGDVKVVDFGIAKAADSSTHTRAGVLKGKFAYMSPEQAAGQRVDRRTDIFALGVVLHELLTGKRLFKRDTDVSTLTAVGECRVERPSQTRAELPEDLDDIVAKSLRRNPKDRYQEAAEFQLALEDWALKHEMPSGAAPLAQFVAGLPAEIEKRAAERERAGRKNISTSNKMGTSAKERPEPLTRQQRSRTSSAPAPAPAPKSDRPQTQVAPAPERSLKVTAPARPAVAILAFLFGIAMVAVLGLSAVLFQSSHTAAVVRVTSVPSGASVFFNGEPLKEKTPLTLPPSGAGAYWLEVSIDGYEAFRSKIEVPAKGELEKSVVLKPLDKN